MNSSILDGRKVANQIQEELASEVTKLKNEGKKVPHLAAILVGDDGASQTYVNNKIKALKKWASNTLYSSFLNPFQKKSSWPM